MTPKTRLDTTVCPFRRLVVSGLLLAAATASACSDPFAVKPQFENADQPYFVHALSGSALPFATGLVLSAKTVTRVDGSFAFDIAFDINAQGDVVLLPVRTVGQGASGSRQVGILKPGGAYANILEAPKTGYVYDSVTVVRKNEPAVIQAQEPTCSLSLSPYLYARIVVDSVDLPNRAIYGHTTINTNCGFRSLALGLPTF
jgi:hypothetical protein